MRGSLLLVVVSLVGCGTRSGASDDSVGDARVDSADASGACLPLADYCNGPAVGGYAPDCTQMGTFGAADCARFKSAHPGTCGGQQAYQLGLGFDTSLVYAYDPASRALVGVVVTEASGTTKTTCWGVVDGGCTFSPTDICAGAPAGDASTDG